MKSDGITTRPLQQASGDKEFNEVFFEDVFVPSENLVGKEGDGWKIAISTLMFERVVLTFARQLQSEVALNEMIHTFGAQVAGSTRVQMAQAIASACTTRALAYEHLIRYAQGGSPGPEGSMDKLLWSESFQKLCKLGVSLRGVEAGRGEVVGEAAHDVHRYLYSRGRTIAAGTSEIQRSIIAERLLGLPRLKIEKA